MSVRPTLTYSPAFTLVPTYECFNRCTYCNFRVDPGQDQWLTLTAAEQRLRSLPQNISEILILSGEVHPRSSRRAAWFDHLYNLCQLALSWGFLPHTNAGILSPEEMAKLKTVNVSMGLMLEQMTSSLPAHHHAPSKIPNLRQQQLEWAGELQIPFTTGLLLGIGETEADWRETLRTIAQIHQQWGHIQEVILQPHSPGQNQEWTGAAFDPDRLVEVVSIARHLLPADIALQIPPNLVSPPTLIACLEAGATDLGGISPLDEVNPDYQHLGDRELATVIHRAGWQCVPRLPIYPQYDSWLPLPLQDRVRSWRVRLNSHCQTEEIGGSIFRGEKEWFC